MYNILSMDGGGSWALIQVMILQDRYGADARGHEILRKYNMAIANSGGSIVLAGMLLDMKLSQIRDMFQSTNTLKEIFDTTGIPVFRDLTGAYKTSSKKKALVEHLVSDRAPAIVNSMCLHEIAPLISDHFKVIITGYDYNRERAVYFRSDWNSPMESAKIQARVSGKPVQKSFEAISLVDAVHVSTNAPVSYFDKPAEFRVYKEMPDGSQTAVDKFGWDGGMGGNNNPIFSGVLEALSYGIDRSDIRVVSIGTANEMKPVQYNLPGDPDKNNLHFMFERVGIENDVNDLRKLAKCIIADPPDSATFNTFHLLGLDYVQNDPRLIRINPLIKPVLNDEENEWNIPAANMNVQEMKTFCEVDMATSNPNDIDLIIRFTKEFINGHVDNQGVRIGGKGLRPILGHIKYADAMRDWVSWGDGSASPPILA